MAENPDSMTLLSKELQVKSVILSGIFSKIKQGLEKQQISYTKIKSQKEITLSVNVSVIYMDEPEIKENALFDKNTQFPPTWLMEIMADFYYTIIYNMRAINDYSFSNEFNNANIHLNKNPIIAQKGEFLNSSKQMAALLLATRVANFGFMRIEVEPVGNIDDFEEEDYIQLRRMAQYKFNGYLYMLIAFVFLNDKDNKIGDSNQQFDYIKSIIFNDNNEKKKSIAHWNVIGQTIESLPFICQFYHDGNSIKLSEPRLLEPIINLVVSYFDLLTICFHDKFYQEIGKEPSREKDHPTDIHLPKLQLLNRSRIEELLK